MKKNTSLETQVICFEKKRKIEIGRTFTSKQTSANNEIKTIFIKLHLCSARNSIRFEEVYKTASAATTTAQISNKSASEREREKKYTT